MVSRLRTALLSRIPPRDWLNTSQILDAFLDWVEQRGIALYPAQEEAILSLFDYKNVILNTPTGSGKSLVATALHLYSLAWGRRSVYTSPIKALVNEKFLALCRDFGPRNVGMITGDAAVNRNAPILCCTAEILANIGLRDGHLAAVDDIIIDEFHYYSDRDRGVAWQVPLLTLPNARFLLMSATLGETSFFEEELTKLNQLETIVIKSMQRPVPLDFIYQETVLHETISGLIKSGRYPIYLVHFTQRECADAAQDLLSVDYCSKEEKKAIAEALEGVKFPSPYGKELQRILRHGIGLHHAGLLPRYRILVERLAQQGLLKIICGTDTLGVGVNIPIRTVLFTKLCKYDGEKTIILSVRDFQQIAGRAGRKGFDELGTVVVQAPEHVIENLRIAQKVENDPKKKNRIVKKQPPVKGFLPWNRETFDRLVNSQPEQLISRFRTSHGMLLSVLSRGKEGCRAMRNIVAHCHETEVTKRKISRESMQIFRSLLERHIVEMDAAGLRLNIELQDDFSLNETLSLYLLDTIKLLDPVSETYAFDLLTLVESILEDPELILRKQLDLIKKEKMGELKAAGMEFEERIAELEKLEYSKPNQEFIYATFHEFAASHPWIAKDYIKPKSIVRDMYERFCSFHEYIREFELQRAEGILLRYLSYVYKALTQTVPDTCKNEEIQAMEAYLGAMIRDVDSSLLEEWHLLLGADAVAIRREIADEEGSDESIQLPDITRDNKTFFILIRNEIFRIVRTLSCGDLELLASLCSLKNPFTGSEICDTDLEKILEKYHEDHEYINTNARARANHNTTLTLSEEGFHWIAKQLLCDPEEKDDWILEIAIDIEASRLEMKPVLALLRLCSAGD